jgi:hypothetical protein
VPHSSYCRERSSPAHRPAGRPETRSARRSEPQHREESALGLSDLAMQEPHEPKANIWKQPLKGWRGLAGWAVVIASLAAVTRIVLGLTALPWWLFMGIALTVAIMIGLLVRCLSSWRNFKRLLLGLACLAGLLVLFYAEEDIRGRLAWGQFKTQWEAKGETFDLGAFIPPPVPDDQNFAMDRLALAAQRLGGLREVQRPVKLGSFCRAAFGLRAPDLRASNQNAANPASPGSAKAELATSKGLAPDESQPCASAPNALIQSCNSSFRFDLTIKTHVIVTIRH